MPKSQVSKTGRITIPEESASFSEGEEDVSARKKKKHHPAPEISNLSSEMAMVEHERVCFIVFVLRNFNQLYIYFSNLFFIIWIRILKL